MENTDQIKLGEAVKKVPAIWDQVKGELQSKNGVITLTYFGAFEGEVLTCMITKFRIGNIFKVSCEWAGQDVSMFLKSHISQIF